MPLYPRTLKHIILILILSLFSSCTTVKLFEGKRSIQRELDRIGTFNEHFTGLAIFDPATNEWIYKKNSAKYFTPASNTKLLTYYASAVTLDERIPALEYEVVNDTIYFSGTGDPTLLHPDFKTHKAFDFLNSHDTTITLVYVPRPIGNKFGSGWAWDDYRYDFQPELSDLPLYGNAIIISKQDTAISINPAIFKHFVEKTVGKDISRAPQYNLFQVGLDAEFEQENIPFITSTQLTRELLADTLNRSILSNNNYQLVNPEILYSVNSAYLFAIMMQRSDNFYAEQLQLIGAHKKGFGWNTAKYRYYITNKYLGDLPQPIIWKDGSGLSRYNLITPESMVKLLQKIEEEVGFEIIKQTFPSGGQSGTLRRWYKADKPYIYAKTGTLSNNHNLSGFILTNSGKRFVFSFMNNNYIKQSSEIKESMQLLLEFVRDNY